MPRSLKALVVLLLIALMPVRAMAGVTMGFCATGHQDMAAAHGGHARDAVTGHEAQDVEHAPVKPGAQRCSICVEHCSNASLAVSAERFAASVAVEAVSHPRAERAAPAFVPDQPDRPPLASLR